MKAPGSVSAWKSFVALALKPAGNTPATAAKAGR
jgi:hypothetical protein